MTFTEKAHDFGRVQTQNLRLRQELKYIFNPRRAGANGVCNEARVRLAMEISPYSDNAYGGKGVVLVHDEMHT